MAVTRSEALIAVRKTKDRLDAGIVMKTQNNRTNHTIETRAKSSASDDAAPELRRIEVDSFPRPCSLEGRKRFSDFKIFLDFAQLRMNDDPFFVHYKMNPLQGRGKAGFTQP